MIYRDFKRIVLSITLILMTCLLVAGFANIQAEVVPKQPDGIRDLTGSLNVPAGKLRLWCGYLWNEIPMEYFGRH
jgi:hypothetical protein